MHLTPGQDMDRSRGRGSASGPRRVRAVAAGAVLLATTAGLLSAAQATPPQDFSETVLATALLPTGRHFTTSRAEVEIDRLTIEPGGDSGWHSHQGPLLLVIKQGTLTNYVVRDGRCVRTVVKHGRSFVESAEVAHLARNEGRRDLVVYAVNNYRKGGPTAVDAEDRYVCDN